MQLEHTDGTGAGIETTRKIIHIDMDAFFASVEQRDNPELRGKPVAVGGAAKRGVVAAASYEARQFGVRSAMPSVTAARKCPELIFVKPRFEVYKAVSSQIHEIFAQYTALIEPLSLDEAYLDVTENLKGMTLANEIARDIRARILAVTGLTASAGISYNKFLAKMASGRNKPNGQFVITPAAGAAYVETLPIGKFHGIGPATAARMNALGIKTGADLKKKPLPFLKEKFRSAGEYYFWIARGVDHRCVKPDRIRKSVSGENTFSDDVHDLMVAKKKLGPIIDKVWRHVEAKELYGRTLTLKIKYSDFGTITRSRTAPQVLKMRSEVEAVAHSLLEPIFPADKGVRLLGISISGFPDHKDTTSNEEQFVLPL
ncbi:DNA polymerase IV [Pelagibacterium sp. H642]|uniref:DNA polymerase IV n=1 Tax=Pelagibacterium sp. H642 TaxID=1881069 RepID=UPI00281592B3|nr:DNA polymerase IV [Pelagibacterium sp. H642]WMT92930.1 DNA polymerase IV [Pelagibacterium sp. H642]